MAQPIWNTPLGSLGVYPALTYLETKLEATPVAPAVTLRFFLLAGQLPSGLQLSEEGVIFGIPKIVVNFTVYDFTVRVIDNNNNFTDRYFTISLSSVVAPKITQDSGQILSTLDSTWVELQIQFSNPKTDNPLTFDIIAGELPAGLEMTTGGIIRGYAVPPTTAITLPAVTTNALSTVAYNPANIANSNFINCQSTFSFSVGRPVVFTTNLANIVAGTVYYIKQVINSTRFKISEVQFGPEYKLTAGTNLSAVTLLPTTSFRPIIKSYSFTVLLESPLGNFQKQFSIEVINQQVPVSENGPGIIRGNRIPAILNTRPETINLTENDKYYGYYFVPSDPFSFTYPPSEIVEIGTYKSDNYFAFKVIGKSFDGAQIRYVFQNISPSLTVNSTTGWVTANLSLAQQGVSKFNFSVFVQLVQNPLIISETYRFSLFVVKNMSETITWVTPSDLGVIPNGSLSSLYVEATADVPLAYTLASGQMPPNLTLTQDGQISGYVAYQPTSTFLDPNEKTVFNFVVRAYSPTFSAISYTKEFTITVDQKFVNPTDTLYIKCTPSESDRALISSLLNNETVIPNEYLFRPEDPYFGKATEVIYEHAYGIFANDLQAYIDAEQINHYWRNITLGPIEIAQARNSNGVLLYEVVYSKVIDNQINPQGKSIPKEIRWPVDIDLNLGPWISSDTNIYTSYDDIQNQAFYTSLTPGTAVVLFPNSLPNMRKQIGDVLGQYKDTDVLPLWMTSQQADGNTLGFVPAWVICYCKPKYITLPDGKTMSYAEKVKLNIETLWTDRATGKINKLNQINFTLDRFSVDKSLTYNFINTANPPAWTSLPSAEPVPDPLDSKDFNVLFPRKTILPNKTQI